jgi:hypothetical protein
VAPVGRSALLAHDSIVFGMVADPEPENAFWIFYAQRSIKQSDANRAVFADSFEMEGWMLRVGFKELKIFIR